MEPTSHFFGSPMPVWTPTEHIHGLSESTTRINALLAGLMPANLNPEDQGTHTTTKESPATGSVVVTPVGKAEAVLSLLAVEGETSVSAEFVPIARLAALMLSKDAGRALQEAKRHILRGVLKALQLPEVSDRQMAAATAAGSDGIGSPHISDVTVTGLASNGVDGGGMRVAMRITLLSWAAAQAALALVLSRGVIEVETPVQRSSRTNKRIILAVLQPSGLSVTPAPAPGAAEDEEEGTDVLLSALGMGPKEHGGAHVHPNTEVTRASSRWHTAPPAPSSPYTSLDAAIPHGNVGAERLSFAPVLAGHEGKEEDTRHEGVYSEDEDADDEDANDARDDYDEGGDVTVQEQWQGQSPPDQSTVQSNVPCRRDIAAAKTPANWNRYCFNIFVHPSSPQRCAFRHPRYDALSSEDKDKVWQAASGFFDRTHFRPQRPVPDQTESADESSWAAATHSAVDDARTGATQPIQCGREKGNFRDASGELILNKACLNSFLPFGHRSRCKLSHLHFSALDVEEQTTIRLAALAHMKMKGTGSAKSTVAQGQRHGTGSYSAGLAQRLSSRNNTAGVAEEGDNWLDDNEEEDDEDEWQLAGSMGDVPAVRFPCEREKPVVHLAPANINFLRSPWNHCCINSFLPFRHPKKCTKDHPFFESLNTAEQERLRAAAANLRAERGRKRVD